MINKKQYIILSFFLTRVLFAGGGFSLIVGISRNDLLITSFLGMLLGYFILYLLYRKGTINKHICSLRCIIVLLLNTLADTTLTSTYLLYTTPTLFILLFYILVLSYGASKEMKVIGRVSEICIPCQILLYLFIPVALCPLVQIDKMLPLFNTSFMNFIKGIIIFTGTSLLPNIILLNYKDNLKFKDVSKGYLLGCTGLIIISFFIISVYGSEFASMLRFPEYLILKKIELFGYVSNVENILVMEWIMNLVISGLFAIKVLKDNLNNIYLLATIILGIVLINELVLNNSYANILMVKNYIYYLFIFIIGFSLIIKKSKKSLS